MALLDVNALVALAWDSHIHHVCVREWFAVNASQGWATCPVTESGFVRVSTNPKVLPSPIGIADALRVLVSLRGADGHRFLSDDVSLTDDDVPTILGQPPSDGRTSDHARATLRSSPRHVLMLRSFLSRRDATWNC